jgi:hypothetical protein
MWEIDRYERLEMHRDMAAERLQNAAKQAGAAKIVKEAQREAAAGKELSGTGSSWRRLAGPVARAARALAALAPLFTLFALV